MLNLKERCFRDNELNDNFVGIRSINNDLQICFPLGFDMSDDKNIRSDVKKLISVLLEYNKAIACENFLNNKNEIIRSNFPLTAYKNVIEYFLSHGYYAENKSYYENSAKGKINFSKTMKKNRPIIQNLNNKNSFIYTRFQVKKEMIKEVYFPKTKWNLLCSNQNPDYLLQPDSIMLFGDKIYILDAKYYKYGISGVASDLPNSASIIKQIVYGEYVAKREPEKEIYNVFLMPFNRFNNPLKLSNIFENIGFANGEWRGNLKPYEKIQGILIDTKFLMQNYNKKSNNLLKLLAKNVEETKI
ncbi:hypothetical protein HpHA290_00840 [Helicobacter pylori]